jgi:hypothetical protein
MSLIMLSVVLPSVITLNVSIPNVSMLSVTMLNVAMLIVITPNVVLLSVSFAECHSALLLRDKVKLDLIRILNKFPLFSFRVNDKNFAFLQLLT